MTSNFLVGELESPSSGAYAWWADANYSILILQNARGEICSA